MLECIGAAIFWINESSLSGFQFTPVPVSSHRTIADTRTTQMFIVLVASYFAKRYPETGTAPTNFRCIRK